MEVEGGEGGVVVMVVGGGLDEPPFPRPPSTAVAVAGVMEAPPPIIEACGLERGVEEADELGEDSSAMGGSVALNPR